MPALRLTDAEAAMMMLNTPPWQTRPRRRRLRRVHLFGGLLSIVLLLLVGQIGLSPWVLHIGGRFTPTMSWSGYGTVTATNGGRYVLFTQFRTGLFLATAEAGGLACSRRGCDDLTGTASMCTPGGATYTFALAGQVHTWLSTEGARTGLQLTGSQPRALPDGWVVAFTGKWHGSALTVATPDNSFTEVFTPRGAIRTTTSTADAGTAAVTLRPGTGDDFTRACGALTAR
jgi:hypothetical protein